MDKNDHLHEFKGFIYGILGAISYSVMAMFVKLSKDISNETLVFFRSLICFALIFPLIRHTKASLKTKHFFYHLIRSLAGLIAVYCFYYASKNLILVDSIILVNTSPLFMPLVILIGFRKKIPLKRLFAIFIGFLGVTLILKPELSIINIPGIVGLGAGLFASIAFVSVGKLSKTEPTERIIFYFITISLIISIFPMIYAWHSIENPIHWLYIFSIGFFAFLFQIFITKSYSYLPATKASPLGFLSIVISGLLGWLIWNNIPDVLTVIGMLLIIGSGLYIIELNKMRFRKK